MSKVRIIFDEANGIFKEVTAAEDDFSRRMEDALRTTPGPTLDLRGKPLSEESFKELNKALFPDEKEDI